MGDATIHSEVKSGGIFFFFSFFWMDRSISCHDDCIPSLVTIPHSPVNLAESYYVLLLCYGRYPCGTMTQRSALSIVYILLSIVRSWWCTYQKQGDNQTPGGREISRPLGVIFSLPRFYRAYGEILFLAKNIHPRWGVVVLWSFYHATMATNAPKKVQSSENCCIPVQTAQAKQKIAQSGQE